MTGPSNTSLDAFLKSVFQVDLAALADEEDRFRLRRFLTDRLRHLAARVTAQAQAHGGNRQAETMRHELRDLINEFTSLDLDRLNRESPVDAARQIEQFWRRVTARAYDLQKIERQILGLSAGVRHDQLAKDAAANRDRPPVGARGRR